MRERVEEESPESHGDPAVGDVGKGSVLRDQTNEKIKSNWERNVRSKLA